MNDSAFADPTATAAPEIAGPGTPPATIDGYVGDSLYPSSYHPAFAPPRTDAILTHRGVAAPRDGARAPFDMVDLGCGDGVGLILNALAHPEGRFIGYDAMPEHIARGRDLARKWGAANIELICATFDDAMASAPADIADYVQCQGVLAWVSPENRARVVALAARMLRPGGALTIGYNCHPGWDWLVPFQRMVRALADGRPGSPVERFEAAVAALRASPLCGEALWTWYDAVHPTLPREYFPHEYLNGHWNPLWASDAVQMMADAGLHFVSDANAMRLRPDFALRRAWREWMDQQDNVCARENAMDLATSASFRTDIYTKGPPRQIPPQQREQARLNQYWLSTTAAQQAQFEAKTPAGTIRFDNASARAILAALDGGPCQLAAIDGFHTADLFNSIDALFVAGLAVPVDAPTALADPERINRMLADEGEAINAFITRHGVCGIGRGRWDAMDAAGLRRAGLS